MDNGSIPNQRRGGRQPGTPNRLTADLRQMVHDALIDAGGKEYLCRQARENPTAFLALVGRCLPKHVHGDLDVTVRDGVRVQMIEELVALALGRQPAEPRRLAEVVALPPPGER